MTRRNPTNEAVADEMQGEAGPETIALPSGEQPAGAGPDREPDPTPAPDRSELVLAAIRRGVPSYQAWAMTNDELTHTTEA